MLAPFGHRGADAVFALHDCPADRLRLLLCLHYGSKIRSVIEPPMRQHVAFNEHGRHDHPERADANGQPTIRHTGTLLALIIRERPELASEDVTTILSPRSPTAGRCGFRSNRRAS